MDDFEQNFPDTKDIKKSTEKLLKNNKDEGLKKAIRFLNKFKGKKENA